MFAKTGTHEDIKREDCLFEPKLDGYRALCFITKDKVSYISRNGNDITELYPELLGIKKALSGAKTCVLDGEIVVFNKKGNPDFNMLHNKYQTGVLGVYVVFDILMKNGKSVCAKTLAQRKKILEKIFTPIDRFRLIVSTDDGKTLWTTIRKRKMEGIVAKNTQSLYHQGERGGDWIKIKHIDTLDCIIIGYTTEKREISALLLGLYDQEEKLNYVGKVGTGFSESTMNELAKKLARIKRKAKPIQQDIKEPEIVWVKPEIVVEVSYNQFTPYKKLRAGSLVRICKDKKAIDCTFMQ